MVQLIYPALRAACRACTVAYISPSLDRGSPRRPSSQLVEVPRIISFKTPQPIQYATFYRTGNRRPAHEVLHAGGSTRLLAPLAEDGDSSTFADLDAEGIAALAILGREGFGAHDLSVRFDRDENCLDVGHVRAV